MLTSTPAHTEHADHRHTDIETHQTKTRKIQYKKSQEAPASFPGCHGLEVEFSGFLLLPEAPFLLLPSLSA